MLLANLLRTLSDEEMKKIRLDFRLPERSRLIFERIAISPSSPPDSEKLAKAIQITKENLYRLCSEIVNECVRILAPKGEFSTMKFFRNKYLYRPFVTEMQRSEKKLLLDKNKDALERLYEFAFVNMMAFPIDMINLDLIETVGQKWHKRKKSPQVDDMLYILLRVIFVKIASLPAKKKMNMLQMSEYSHKLLGPISHEAESSKNPLVKYQYYQNQWKAGIYEKNNPDVKIAWLRKSLVVIRENKTWFEPELEQVLVQQIAYELALNSKQIQEGLLVFRLAHHGQTPDTSRGALFLSRYIRIAFLAGDFETARRILSDFIEHQAVKSTASIYIMALLLKSQLDIVEELYDNASHTIEKLKSLNSENFFLAYEVQIRGLETLNALKHGDISLADQLAERNIKWLWSRKVSLGVSAWIYFYQIIQSIIIKSQIGGAIKPALLDHFKNDFRSEHPDFFLLLESEL